VHLLPIVVWPTGKNDNLEHACFLSEKRTESVHPFNIALNELIVQDDGCAEVLRQR
jgi:hypothetical protein